MERIFGINPLESIQKLKTRSRAILEQCGAKTNPTWKRLFWTYEIKAEEMQCAAEKEGKLFSANFLF